MPTLILLRHGESIWNDENRFTGWTDVDLTERGLAQAHLLGVPGFPGTLFRPRVIPAPSRP